MAKKESAEQEYLRLLKKDKQLKKEIDVLRKKTIVLIAKLK